MRTSRPLSLLFIFVLLWPLAGCATKTNRSQPGPGATPPPEDRPRLILLLVIDQARSDYLDRYRSLLSGGLGRLMDTGIFFSQAYHGHARTHTATGHAALATGVYPSRHGIIANQWFDREEGEDAYCVGDPVHGRSPVNLLSSTLGDWLKKSDPASLVYSASGKDRAAILMGGHEADAAFWYDRQTGEFVSSSYYPMDSPAWLTSFNDHRIPDQTFGTPWEPLPLQIDLAPFGVVQTDEGIYTTGFPRALGGSSPLPGPRYYGAYLASPAGDRYLGHLAREIVEREHLGQDDHPDLLALSFSSLDYVGHAYGPDSPEVLDTLLRLDRVLGELLSFLEQEVGGDRLLVALSSDHGVLAFPEFQTGPEEKGRRFTTEDLLCQQGAGRRLRERLGDGDWLLDDYTLNEEAIIAGGLEREQVISQLADIYEDCPAVHRAWTAAILTQKDGDTDPSFPLFANNYHEARSPDVMLQVQPGILPFADRGTSHGSPYSHDTHVPVILVAPGYEPGRVTSKILTVDLAPTLAALAGVAAPAGLDGVSRLDWLQESHEPSLPDSAR